MKSYHYAWLKAHPYRTEEWLEARLKDGFDVHHIDGDTVNEKAENLCLIEHGDHMALHGMEKGRLHRLHGGKPKKGKKLYPMPIGPIPALSKQPPKWYFPHDKKRPCPCSACEEARAGGIQ